MNVTTRSAQNQEKDATQFALYDQPNFKVVADDANDGIVIATQDEGRLVYANQRASALSGYTIHELLRKELHHVLSQNGDAFWKNSRQRRQRENGRVKRYITEIVHKNGYLVPVEISKSNTKWRGEPAILILMNEIHLSQTIEDAKTKGPTKKSWGSDKLDRRRSGNIEKADKNRHILKYKLDLERANKELVQTNTALSVLARSINKKSSDLENEIAHRIRTEILPLVDLIRQDPIDDQTMAKLQLLKTYLRTLTPWISKSREIFAKLSFAELRIAMLIKNNLKTNEITKVLRISPHTVKAHRRTIRKKLSIHNSKINLASYLKVKLGVD